MKVPRPLLASADEGGNTGGVRVLYTRRNFAGGGSKQKASRIRLFVFESMKNPAEINRFKPFAYRIIPDHLSVQGGPVLPVAPLFVFKMGGVPHSEGGVQFSSPRARATPYPFSEENVVKSMVCFRSEC